MRVMFLCYKHKKGYRMLLAVDSGNTNVVFALYDDQQQVAIWRLQNLPMRTADEYAVLLAQFLSGQKITFDTITALIVSSVVPLVEENLYQLWQNHITHADLRIIGIDNFIPQMNVLIDYPEQLGSDRLINGWQAYQQYQTGLIVVDFGTATTFDVVDDAGQYEGGIIAPGIQLSMQALVKGTAKLSMSHFTKPQQVIGKNTQMAMQSGFFYGAVGTVETMIARIKKQMKNEHLKIIATGGYAPLIAEETSLIEEVDQNLTLNGLIALYYHEKTK